MVFNDDKLQLLRVGNQDSNFSYVSPNDSVIKSVDSCKDLGIMFDKDGSFSTHINEKISKARKISGYILRTFSTRNRFVLLSLFKSIVLPIIEYGSVVWSPSDIATIARIESIERTFTCRIHGVQELDYWERLKELNIYSLERRRERYYIIYMFKIILGTVPNPGITWFENPRRGRLIFLPHLSMKSNNGCKLKRQSFCYAVPQLFNSLPADIRNFDGSMSD